MKFFNRDKKVETKEKTTKKRMAYKITVCDPLGESPREINTFGAEKVRDNDGVVWLSNEDKAFKEIFPLDSDNVVRYSKESIDKEISKIEKSKIGKNENALNKESRLLELKKLKKGLENPKGSFLKIDKDGTPHLFYLRYRTAYVPIKWNLDFSTVHTPVEPLIKNVLTTQLDKMKKYNQTKENIISGGMIFFMLILIIWTAVLGYMSLKFYAEVDNSQVQALQNRIDNAPLICAELYGAAGENFYQTSVYGLNVTKTMYERLYPDIDTTPQQNALE
jgi:hypothetical protein